MIEIIVLIDSERLKRSAVAVQKIAGCDDLKKESAIQLQCLDPRETVKFIREICRRDKISVNIVMAVKKAIIRSKC